MLVGLQVFLLTESFIDWWVVGVTADISPGALLRKSKLSISTGVQLATPFGRRDGWPSDYCQRGGLMEKEATFNKLLEAGGRAGLMGLVDVSRKSAGDSRLSRTLRLNIYE